MVNKDIASLVIFKVSDLQAIGVPSFFRLERGIDRVNFNYHFGFLCLK